MVDVKAANAPKGSRIKHRDENVRRSRSKSCTRRRKRRSKSNDNGQENNNHVSRGRRTTSGSKQKKKMEVEKDEGWNGQLNQYSRSFSPSMMKKRLELQRSGLSSDDRERNDTQPYQNAAEINEKNSQRDHEPKIDTNYETNENFPSKIMLSVGAQVHEVVEASIKKITDFHIMAKNGSLANVINCEIPVHFQDQQSKISTGEEKKSEISNSCVKGIIAYKDQDECNQSHTTLSRYNLRKDATASVNDLDTNTLEAKKSNDRSEERSLSARYSSDVSERRSVQKNMRTSVSPSRSRSSVRSRTVGDSETDLEKQYPSRKKSSFNRMLKMVAPQQNTREKSPSRITSRLRGTKAKKLSTTHSLKSKSPTPMSNHGTIFSDTHINSKAKWLDDSNVIPQGSIDDVKSPSTPVKEGDKDHSHREVNNDESSESESEFITVNNENNRTKTKPKRRTISFSGFVKPKIQVKNSWKDTGESHYRSRSTPNAQALQKGKSERLPTIQMATPKKKIVKHCTSVRTGLRFKE